MSDELVIQLVRDAFYQVILISGPLLLLSLVIGLIISIFQAATSISEQTLTYVPKLLAVFIVTILFLPFMLNSMKAYVINLFKILESLK